MAELKDHQIAQTVNALTIIAREYGQTQQLRERIAQAIVPILKGQQECPLCRGDGCTNEGDPEIGNAYFECTRCGGTGGVPSNERHAVHQADVVDSIGDASKGVGNAED